jgi:hypothetical protein
MPSPLRCGLNIRRRQDSISQNIQTNAVPRPTTTIRNINVNAGAVSMFNIPHAVRTACQRTISVTARYLNRALASRATKSAAHLHGPYAPAVWRQHTAPHDVAAAVAVVIGVVIAAVVRIAVIIIVVVVAVAQA